MGRRSRQRGRADKLQAPRSEYATTAGDVLVLRGALTPATRSHYAEVLAGGLQREDARQRAIELLFEHLAVSWTISGVVTERPQRLLARYRMATAAEREFVLDALRTHVAEHFPEVDVP